MLSKYRIFQKVTLLIITLVTELNSLNLPNSSLFLVTSNWPGFVNLILNLLAMSSEFRAAKRKRGVVHRQINHIYNRLSQLCAKTDEPQAVSHAHRMANKLEELDTKFKSHYYTSVELIESDEHLAREQAILNECDDEVAHLEIQVKELISSCNPSPDAVSDKKQSVLCRKLAHLKKQVDSLGQGHGQ